MNKNTRTLLSVLMILVGALLVYAGIKNKNPISVLQVVLSGQSPDKAVDLDPQWIGKKIAGTSGDTSSGGTVTT